MTNLWLACLPPVLTLAILGALWFHYRRVTTCLNAAAFALASAVHQTERSLRSHVVDECNEIMSNVSAHGAAVKREIKSTEESVINFVTEHADSLHKHAEDLRNHAKGIADRAEVEAARTAFGREAVLRPRI